MEASVGLIFEVLAAIPIGTLLFMGLAKSCFHPLQQSNTSPRRTPRKESASPPPFIRNLFSSPLAGGRVRYISLVIEEKPVSSSGTS